MIIVFDSKCLLCNSWVQFLLKRDKKEVFKFASIQSIKGQQLLLKAKLPLEGLQTLLVVDGLNSWQHTYAIFRVLNKLGWPWKAVWIFWMVPAPLRDALYRWIARNRYWLFGRSEVCILPPSNYKDRFSD